MLRFRGALNQIQLKPHFKLTPQAIQPKASTSPNGLTPLQLRSGYGVDTTGLDGEGEIVAVIDAYSYPSAQADFVAFDSYFNLGNPSALKVINMGSNTASDPNWSLESALDIQAMHTIAPMATIYLILCASSSLASIRAGVLKAKALKAAVISLSLGTTESKWLKMYDSMFSDPDITFVASAGDTADVINWPSSCPNVISAGGTSLTLTSENRRLNETVWNGTGCGTSAIEPIPLYQSSNGIQGTHRQTPDVCAVADPNTGMSVYNTLFNSPSNPWITVGGTSLSTPLIAGMICLINQKRVQLSKPRLNAQSFLTYAYSLSTNAYGSDFFDITQGASGSARAKTGDDVPSGIGAPENETGSGQTTTTTAIYTAQLSTGVGVPADTLGQDTDVYIDTQSGFFYTKATGSWVKASNVFGPNVSGPTQTTSTVAAPAGGNGFILDFATNI